MRHPYYQVADMITQAQRKSGLSSLRKLERHLGIGHDVLAKALRNKAGLYGRTVNRLLNFLGYDYERERLNRLIMEAGRQETDPSGATGTTDGEFNTWFA